MDRAWDLGLRRIGGNDDPTLYPKAQRRDRDSQKERGFKPHLCAHDTGVGGGQSRSQTHTFTPGYW